METDDERRTMKYDCVILANGDFPTHRIPLEVLHGAKFCMW